MIAAFNVHNFCHRISRCQFGQYTLGMLTFWFIKLSKLQARISLGFEDRTVCISRTAGEETSAVNFIV